MSQQVIAWTSASMAATILVMPLVIRLLRSRSVVDVPNARSSHSMATPRGGGLAILIATVVAIAVATALLKVTREDALLFVVVLLYGIVGWLDDMVGLSAYLRLATQFVLAGLLTVPLGMAGLALPLIPIACGFVVVFVNTFNFMDGINGISGITATLASGWYVWVGVDHRNVQLALLSAVMLGAAVGFLPFNCPRARVFLGDVGSYFVGAYLAILSVLSYVALGQVLVSLAPMCIYLADVLWTLGRRAVRRANLTQPHRDHTYQRLTDILGSHARGALTVAAFVLSICLLTALFRGSWSWTLMALASVVAFYLLTPRLVARLRG